MGCEQGSGMRSLTLVMGIPADCLSHTDSSVPSGLSPYVCAVSVEDSIKAKKAFVASATALKDLADAVGLTGTLKGL